MQQRTLVFVDEVHRFNKSQQDAFLPHVEAAPPSLGHHREPIVRGELGPAVAAAVYVLQPLSADDLKQIVALAQSHQAVPAMESIAIDRLVAYADGDARKLLNTLETLAMAATQEKAARDHRRLAAESAGRAHAPL